MITSKDLEAYRREYAALMIDINDNQPFYNGEDVSTARQGHGHISALSVFELAAKARDEARRLLAAADAMDARIQAAWEAAA